MCRFSAYDELLKHVNVVVYVVLPNVQVFAMQATGDACMANTCC